MAATEDDLTRIDRLIDGDDALKHVVRSPVFTRHEQQGTILAIVDRIGVTDLTRKFIGLVAKNRRLFALQDIASAYRHLHAQARGEVSAHVTSAQPLSEQHVKDLRATLKKQIGKDVDLVTRVDPSLLGGLVVQLGSRMIDTSLKAKLAALRIAMKGAR